MNTDPVTAIDQLPEPSAPSSIERVVMARIAQMADAPVRPAREAERRVQRNDAPAWAATIAGVALFVLSWVGGYLSLGIQVLAQVAPIEAFTAFDRMPQSIYAFAGLALGAILFVTGLFARDYGTPGGQHE